MKRCSSSEERQGKKKCVKRAQQKRRQQEDDRYKSLDLQRQGARRRFARQYLSQKIISVFHHLLQEEFNTYYGTYVCELGVSEQA